MRVRMGILAAVVGLGAAGVLVTAYQVQVREGADWRAQAEAQRERKTRVTQRRGGVYDRSGAPLAVSVDVPSVSVDTMELLRDAETPAAKEARIRDVTPRIAAALGMDPGEVYGRLSSPRRFQWLKRRVTADEITRVRALSHAIGGSPGIRGLAVDGEGKRFYPGRASLGPVLGFVSPDGEGKDGIELRLDEELRGRTIETPVLRDRAGRMVYTERSQEGGVGGHDLRLTIDEAIQHEAEREAEAALGTYEAAGVSIVVMVPKTGEILAVASAPSYNPNDYAASDPGARRARALTDRFEPGSVMKTFTMAAALAGGAVSMNDLIDCERGAFKVGNVTIHDTHPADLLTPTQILAKSSNIGTLKIALRLGQEPLYSALRRFGFGDVTGLPLPGEASGVLRPRGRPWVDVETANASFGQGISVTNMQLAFAMGAIANGGKLMEPLLVKRVTDESGTLVREYVPRVRREVVPPGVARTVSEMLGAVVAEGGTGVEAAIPGFRTAGKTATAQKADPKTGKYSQDHYVASFAGFAPLEAPRVVVSVVIDDPMVGHYGGDVAGPVFRRIGASALRYLGVVPAGTRPDLRVQREPNMPASTPSEVAAEEEEAPWTPPRTVDVGPEPASDTKVPDVSNRSAREVVRAMSAAGLRPALEGSGHAVRLVPAAGTIVAKGTEVRVVLEP